MWVTNENEKQSENSNDWKMKLYARILVAPVVAVLIGAIAYSVGMSGMMAKVTTVAIWMMIWWLDNFVRMGLTGLLPIVLLPFLAVNPGNKISSVYFSDGMILCIGSLLMAHAIESCELHILAAKIINHYSESRGTAFILLVFIFLTGFLSMWISNTATAALMLPIANAFVVNLMNRSREDNHKRDIEAIGCALDLAIAFAASLGGMATLIGTGSNIVLMGVMKSVFGQENEEVTFLGWLLMAGPLSIVNLLLLWVLLCACFLWKIPYLYNFTRISQANSSWRTEINQGDQNIEVEMIENIMNHSNSGDSLKDSREHLFGRSVESDAMERKCSEFQELEEIEEINFRGPSFAIRLNNDDDEPNKAMQVAPDFELTYSSKIVIGVFLTMAVLWITRDPPGNWGWSPLLKVDAYVTDGTVAMAACLLLMILPKRPPSISNANFNHSLSSFASLRNIVARFRHQTLLSSSSEHDEHDSDKLSSSPSSQNKHKHQTAGIASISSDKPSMHHRSRFQTTNLEKFESIFPNSQDDNDDEEGNSTSSRQQQQQQSHTTKKETYEAILPWTAVQTLNWDVIFLLGGGFALSQGFEASGLSTWISQWMVHYGPKSLPGFIAVASMLSCLITNVMSNVAAANVILPSLVCLGPHYGYSPLSILMPVTFSISLAFLFPMGTPPNAIVMSNQRVNSKQLLTVGLLMSVLSLTTVILYCTYALPIIGNLHHVSTTVKQTCHT